MSVTTNIDRVLKMRNMSRRQLALAAKIPPSTLQSALARGGNMSAKTLQVIADTLNVTVNSLLGPDNYWIDEDGKEHMEPMEPVGREYKALSRIAAALGELNITGQEEAVKRVEELTEIPKYKKEEGDRA